MAGDNDQENSQNDLICREGLIANIAQSSFKFPYGILGTFISGMDSFERLLWWLFAGSTGAETRYLVLDTIKEQPRNAQQLSQILHLDYTTVRHHLRVLEQNRLIVTEGEKYGKLYFLSDVMEGNWPKLESIISRTRQGAKTKPKPEGSKTEGRVQE